MNGPEQGVLHDLPGPKARRRALVGSLIAAVALLGAGGIVVRRLADAGQFSSRRWAPLVDPSAPEFAQVWALLGTGLRQTLVAAALAITASMIVGTLLGVARMMLGRWGRVPLIGVMELLRGLPVVITIFFAYRVLPTLGVDVSFLPGEDGLWYLLVGLTVYNSVVIAEILRAGVRSLPGGQREAALTIGLTSGQTMRMVLLPQAFRVMLPSLISQLVVILKDTSLGGMLGLYTETLRQANRISQLLGNPLQLYLVVGVLFILINGSLSFLAQRLEQGLARGRRVPLAEKPVGPADPAGPVGPADPPLDLRTADRAV